MTERPRVYWRGAFLTNASLAIVNRRLVRALIDRNNVDVSIGTDFLSAKAIPPDLRFIADQTAFGAEAADVVVVHEWPPRFAAPEGPRYVHVQPWEYGSMPQSWFEALHDDCDALWVHSTYNKNAYLDAGFASERLSVIPHGIDPRVFTPEGPKMAVDGERFRFVFVGGTIPRKGIDVLVNAYLSVFGPRDDVALMIKDVDSGSYRSQTQSNELRGFANRRDLPRIEYVDQTVPDEAIAQIFRGSNCLVLPYRGEGFGLPVLEAMGCGLPAIVTDGGATDDLVDDSVGWRIPSRRTNVDPATVPFPTVTPPWLLEPDFDALRTLLRYAYDHRDEVLARGAAAASRAHSNWTWDRAAEHAEGALFDCVGRTRVDSKHRHERYGDASAYAERFLGTGKLDGVVLELVRRLGPGQSIVVDVGRGEFTVATAVARGYSWPAITIDGSSQTAITAALGARDLPAQIDVLSLDCANPSGVLDILASRYPRIVASRGAAVIGPDYECVARDGEDAVFIRADLRERSGFALQSGTRDRDVLGVPVADRLT